MYDSTSHHQFFIMCAVEEVLLSRLRNNIETVILYSNKQFYNIWSINFIVKIYSLRKVLCCQVCLIVIIVAP